MISTPITTNNKATSVRGTSRVSASFNNQAESITPNTGFKKPYTDTFDTGLCLSNVLHNEKAAEEINAR